MTCFRFSTKLETSLCIFSSVALIVFLPDVVCDAMEGIVRKGIGFVCYDKVVAGKHAYRGSVDLMAPSRERDSL